MEKIKPILYCCIALIIFGCASAKKAELSSTDNPEAAVSEVAEMMKKAEKEQHDLLSFNEYMDGAEYLGKAKLGLSRSHKSEIILDNAGIAKAYFEDAANLSRARSSNATRILQARNSSLKAGLRNNKDLAADLADVDEDLRDETDNFAQALEPNEFSEFQKKYFSLEVKAVQFRELDGVRNTIKKAEKANAEDLAPQSLRAALLDLNEAENFIAQSPRNPEIHKDSVNKAIESLFY